MIETPGMWARGLMRMLALIGLLGFCGAAFAVPSFARQTGMACATCHVGGFGPQLTDFGIRFKLGGYTLGKSGEAPTRFSAMAIGSFSQSEKDQEPAPDHARANNNLTLDQVSIFYAGRLAESLGIFSQATYDGIAHQLELDNVDLRAAKSFSLEDHSALAGVSVHNAPGLSDPYNTLPAWGFPFVGSAVAPTPEVGTLLDGALAQRVLGFTAYTQIDGRWYGELGTYRSLSQETQARLGLGRADDPGILHGALYARLAAEQRWGAHTLAVGSLVLATRIQPDRGDPSRLHYRDTGVDASYRWTPAPEHSFTVLASVVEERQKRDPLVAAGAATNGHGRLTEHSLTGAWFWRNTWGVSLQRLGLRGSSDELLYADGFANGSPDWSATRLQVDWTPSGKKPLGAGLDVQWRLGLQYTAWDKFNGAKTNYDGAGRDANDNNTLFAFVWMAF